MPTASQNEWFAAITDRSDTKTDIKGHEYATITITAQQAVTRFNPITSTEEVVVSKSKTFVVNSWKDGVDSPWNHLFPMAIGAPVMGQPMRCDVQPYDIKGKSYTSATLFVPDFEGSATWAKSLATMMRWDGYKPGGEMVLPVSIVETTGEEATVTKGATLDV